ncbi:MAG: PxKF domain-containing protein [Geobacter sp.]|nr:PxKF domain-containing protein [Geobacter sp.]
MPALAAGESKTITGTFAVPVMTNGTYYVGGYADTYNWIEESNETNNALAGNQIGIGLVTPIANAGPDQTIECPITTEVSVALDGSHSYDPNGDPLTYTWSWGGGTASGVKPMITLPSGRTTITLTVNDGNGHTASDAVVVTVGDTIPPVTSASLIGVLGEDGWYKSDVTVILQAADACSHVKEVHYIVDNGEETVVTADSKSFSTNFVVSQEGEHTVTYWSVDNTGNGGTRITTQPINKHYTPPPPGGRGTGGSPGDGSSSAYYPSCVYVTLQVTEGVSQYSTDNGATWQPYTGAFAICDTTTVLYDNVEAPKTITINIDKTPPTITAIIYPPPNENGWYNTDVIVTFACTDDASGVAICPDPITVTTEGAGQTVSGTAYDFAGNSATTSVIINIDKTLPTITATVTPQPDANGWNSTDVTVSFTCSDNLSAFTPCPSPVTVTTEGAGQVITGTVTDQAGNIATASVTVNIDKSAPTISASINPVPNEAGWNNTDVTVSFDCADSGAGIAACTSPVTVTMEGQDQIITGRAIDKVGKTAEVPVTLNIDKTPPVITISGVEDGAVYTPCNVPVPSYSVTDSSSRVSSQNSTLTGGNANGTGAFIYTVTASDNAGNIITRSVYYKVEYSFGGFEAPVTLLKPFKQGSTVPVKLTIADGCENSISTAIVTLTLQLYSGETPVGDPIDATSNVPDSGNLFRYTDGHYIYNLSTGNLQSGSYVVSVTLDDGSTKTITLQIKP